LSGRRPPRPKRCAQEEQARRLIDDATQTANDTAGGLHIQTKAIAGAPVPALLELSNHAQIVVVGRRGRSSSAGVLLGSVSTAMINRARCPVAVIHDESPPRRRLWMRLCW
jgi:nucleotide-binding universal stress UspA family protein